MPEGSKMAVLLEHILAVLEELAPCRLCESWDNSGLQLGSRGTPIHKILVSLDPTLAAVRKAAQSGAQLLLTHHPLIFKPVSCLDPDLHPGDVLHEAIRRGIAIVAAHTNLDSARGGLNDLLAGLFGLGDVEVLEEKGGSRGPGEGLGRIGVLPERVTLPALVLEVKRVFEVLAAGVIGSSNLRIRRVAVVGGAGGSMIPAASRRGAEVLITGDVGHHHALDALLRGVAVIDAGHFYTEKAAMKCFCVVLKSRLDMEVGKRIEVEFLQEETAPMRIE